VQTQDRRPCDYASPCVIDYADNGAIIIQHDGGGDRSQTLAALPREIDTLRSHGYRLVTIPQPLGLRLLYRSANHKQRTRHRPGASSP